MAIISKAGSSKLKNREVVHFQTGDLSYTPTDWNPGRISTVINHSAAAITFNGESWASGTWDLSEVGGVPTEGDSELYVYTASAGGLIVEFRR